MVVDQGKVVVDHGPIYRWVMLHGEDAYFAKERAIVFLFFWVT